MKLFGLAVIAIALYLFVSYWPGTVSNGALTTVQTQIERKVGR